MGLNRHTGERILNIENANKGDDPLLDGCIESPFLSVDLEDSEQPTTEWHAKALRVLAAQLTVSNDFFYPLLGAAGHLEADSTPVGYRLVPGEPTDEMKSRGAKSLGWTGVGEPGKSDARDCYRAMIAAAHGEGGG